MASRSATDTPPYASAARISDSQCFPQYTASLKCLEEFSTDKSKRQEHLMFIKNARKRRGKLGWNATRVGHSSRELVEIFYDISSQ